MLSSIEKTTARADMTVIIESFGTTGILYRPTVGGGGSFAGSHEESESEVSNGFPLEWRQLSPEDLKQIGADGMIHVKHDLDIHENDVLLFETIRYRVTDVSPKNLFGVLTHQVVKLEREYRS